MVSFGRENGGASHDCCEDDMNYSHGVCADPFINRCLCAIVAQFAQLVDSASDSI